MGITFDLKKEPCTEDVILKEEARQRGLKKTLEAKKKILGWISAFIFCALAFFSWIISKEVSQENGTHLFVLIILLIASIFLVFSMWSLATTSSEEDIAFPVAVFTFVFFILFTAKLIFLTLYPEEAFSEGILANPQESTLLFGLLSLFTGLNLILLVFSFFISTMYVKEALEIEDTKYLKKINLLTNSDYILEIKELMERNSDINAYFRSLKKKGRPPVIGELSAAKIFLKEEEEIKKENFLAKKKKEIYESIF